LQARGVEEEFFGADGFGGEALGVARKLPPNVARHDERERGERGVVADLWIPFAVVEDQAAAQSGERLSVEQRADRQR
jgi:hypothetical protein